MQRREFVAGLGSAATWALAAVAQQPEVPVVGLLSARSAQTAAPVEASFRRGLEDTGFVEGRNAAILYRYASGQLERLPELAAELVSHRVNVIVAGHPAGAAAKAATATIPIVFVSGTDPVRNGLVRSINRPGGNATGVSTRGADLETKRIGLLRELVPKISVMGALIDATSGGGGEFQLREVKEAARRLGLPIEVVTVESERDLDGAFATLTRERVDALVIGASTLFNTYRDRVVALATRYRIPTVYELREFAEAGGLMTYAPSITDIFRQAGTYTGRILKGDRPADLPVLLPTKFELVLNLKTAKALGLTFPETLLATADEVIQ